MDQPSLTCCDNETCFAPKGVAAEPLKNAPCSDIPLSLESSDDEEEETREGVEEDDEDEEEEE
eukprot:11433092-Karenia_brevis.AAC.1